MPRTRFLLAVLLLLALAAPARAAVKFDVTVSGIDLPDSEVDRLVVLVGDIQKTCAEVFGIGYRYNQTVNLRIFGSMQEFRKHGGAGLAALGDHIQGYYNTRPMEVVVCADQGKEQMARTLLHECTHLFLYLGCPNIPMALNEGLAEYFENASLQGGSFRVAPDANWELISRVALQRDSLPDLDLFLDLPMQEWQRLDAGQIPVRAVSWAIAGWLMDSSQGRRTLAAFLQGLSRARGLSPSQFLARVAGDKIDALDRDWQNWVAGAHPWVTLDISSPGSGNRGLVFRN